MKLGLETGQGLSEQRLARPATPSAARPAKSLRLDQRQVLHVGCGPAGGNRLHGVFRHEAWAEVRLDIDPAVKPDLLGTITDMRSVADDGQYDALWASHTVEHLQTHEVPRAFREFARVLGPDGFALVRTPDLEAVALSILDHGVDHVAYVAPAGPITPLDMLFGHGRALRAGNRHMAHATAFTAERLGRLLLAAGFAEVRTRSLPEFDLWAVAMKPGCDVSRTLADLAGAGLDFRDDG